MKSKGIKEAAVIAMLIALYFVLSAMLKIPVAGHITLDLGYIALMVAAVRLGAAAKMFIDCAMYSLPVALKIPTTLAAWLSDSLVMLAIGLPLSIALEKRIK